MAGGDTSASRDALARAVAAAKAAARPRVASVFAKSSDPRYAPRPEANYGERWEAQEALATVAGAGAAAAKLGLVHPEHDACEGTDDGETRTRAATTSGRPNDPNEDPTGTRPTWVETVDADSGVPYYFNPETRETSWDAPNDAHLLKHDTPRLVSGLGDDRVDDGRVENDTAVPSNRAASPEETAAKSLEEEGLLDEECEKKRWWYRDDAGAWRGPYRADRLRFWRTALPALLPVTDRDPTSALDRDASFVETHATTLARILGDEGLLRRAATFGIAAHPRATAAQIERAVADVSASLHLGTKAAKHTTRAADPIDPSAIRSSAPIAGGADATLNRVVGRPRARPNDADDDAALDGDGDADRERKPSRRRRSAGPGPSKAEVAMFKERKRRRRDAWLDA